MKKLMKLMMGIAVAAISFTGCENNFEGANVENKGFELTVVADNISRTEYDATLQDIKWSAGDAVRVFVKGAAKNLTATIDANDNRIASFVYGTTLTAGDEILIQGFYPTTAVTHNYDATEASGNRTRLDYVTIALPANQTATVATFDKSADILVADDMTAVVTEAEKTAGKKTVGNFHFRRQVAVTEFTYTVTNTELLASDEKVDYVTFEVVSANNDKFLAGNMRFQLAEDGAKIINSEAEEITDNKNLFVGSQKSVVKVTLSDTPALKSGFKAWFVTSPVTLAADDKLIFTVVTDAGTTITKTVNAVGKELSFSTTQKNILGVKLDNTVAIEKEEVDNTLSTATLTSNDITAINKIQGYSDAAREITATDGSVWYFKGYRQAANSNFLQLKAQTDSSTPYVQLPEIDGEIQSVVLSVGSASAASAGGNTRAYNFNETIGASKAVVSASGDSEIVLNVEGKGLTTGYIQANGGATRIFEITMYYKAGEPVPVLSVVAQPAVVDAGGDDVTVELKAKNLSEDITISENADWITNTAVADDNKTLTFTVAENTVEEERTATITLTSGDLTAEVTVTQEAMSVATGVKWVKVTSASDITAGGEYIIAGKHTGGTYGYMPNGAVSSGTVSLKANDDVEESEIDDSKVSADMKWTLVASGSGFKIQSMANSSNILYTNSSTGKNVRIGNGSSRNVWTIAVDSKYGWKIDNGTHRLAIYDASSVRNYTASSTTNQNGTFIIFKKTN